MKSSLSRIFRSRFFRLIRWGIVLVIFLFLGKMVWDNWSQVRETPFTLRIVPFVWATLLFTSSYFILIWAWYLITLKLKVALSPPETVKVWLYSQLGKYIPGKIWLFLGRVYYYETRGKSKKSVSVALYFETILVVVASGLIFLASLLFFKETRLSDIGRQLWWLVLAFIFLAFIFLHPRILQRILNGVLVKLKREPISLAISYSEVLQILLVCLLDWCVGGVGFYLFVHSVFPVPFSYAFFIIGSLAISNTLGMIALFAPSGLGVREGVLVYLLSFIMPGPVAVILSVLTRLWITFIEIGLIGMVYLIDRLKNSAKGRIKYG